MTNVRTQRAWLLRGVMFASCIGVGLAMSATPASATVVRFETVMGNYDIRLWPGVMPNSVNNMLAYINADRYDGTFVHRSLPGFVIQGGGFTYNPPPVNTAPP